MWDFSLCCVYVMDAHFATDASKFIAGETGEGACPARGGRASVRFALAGVGWCVSKITLACMPFPLGTVATISF